MLFLQLQFQADWICLLANTNSDKPAHLSKSLICVPMDLKGINLAKRIDKMGMRCSDTAIINFDDVRVPAKNIIGEEGFGFTYQMLQFQQERLACAALSLVPLERCITDTIEYTRNRMAFGQPLLNNQVCIYLDNQISHYLIYLISCWQVKGKFGQQNLLVKKICFKVPKYKKKKYI